MVMEKNYDTRAFFFIIGRFTNKKKVVSFQ